MAATGWGGPVVEYVRWLPAPPLRPFVAWYSGYREAGVPPARHRGLPSPHLTLIITLDDPLVVAAHPDPRTPPGQYATLVGGLHTVPALITHAGCQSGVQLMVTPLGARALLGLPAAALASTDLDATVVCGPWADRLRERLLAADGWPQRFAALDAALLGRARVGSRLPDEVAYAWHRVLATGGTVGVSELVGEIGWSGRHLSQRFRAEIGLGVKEFARVVRFDRARRLLQQPMWADRTLAELAAACGFYDQSHLAREFGALAGCSPSQWLAEEFRNVQGTGDADS